MDLDEILLTTEDSMEKAVVYLKSELRGVRTGRASTGLVDFIKVDYYGSPTDLRSIALVNIAGPTQILIKPFDAASVQPIVKAIQTSGLGLNPLSEGKQVRLNLPPLSGENRNKLVASIKAMGEQAKITIRNARRDGNKQLEQVAKDKSAHVSEDQVEGAKNDVQELVKKYEHQVEELMAGKTKEITETETIPKQ